MLSRSDKKDSELNNSKQKIEAEKPESIPIKKDSKKEEKPKKKEEVSEQKEVEKASKKAKQ